MSHASSRPRRQTRERMKLLKRSRLFVVSFPASLSAAWSSRSRPAGGTCYRDLLVPECTPRAGTCVLAAVENRLAVDDHVDDAFAVLERVFVRGVVDNLGRIE